MKVSEFQSKLPVVEFVATTPEGFIVKGKCRPANITESMIEKASRSSELAADAKKGVEIDATALGAAGREAMAAEREIIVSSVAEWDLQLENGDVAPIDNDYIKDLNVEIRSAVSKAVMETERPNRKTVDES